MRIGLDLSMLVYAGSGVATYTFELAKNLLKVDKKNSYIGFYSSLRRPANFYYLEELKKLGAKIFDYRLPPTLLRFLWGRHQLIPVEWLIGKIDIFHSSDFLRPPQQTAKGVTTVHDLTWYFYPEYHTQRIVEAHKRKMELTLKYEDEIITVSKSTKKDLCKVFNIDQNRIHIIYEGVDHKKFKMLAKPGSNGTQNSRFKINQVLEKYQIRSPYILYVGAIEPRKNLPRLLEAFKIIVAEKTFKNFSLVIAGRAGWKNENVFNLVKKLGLGSRVIFTGFVENDDLPYLYNVASVFAYPSLYEGFGLPVLEAMACGTPVVTSAVSSLPEVAGEAAVYVDPNSVKSIASGIEKILKNSKVELEAARRKLLQQAKKFTWEETARGTLKIYQDVYRKSVSQ